MPFRLSKPSPSMVISVLALSVATGGTSYAATTIGSRQITNDSILSRDVHNDTLRGKDIREGTLAKVPSAAAVDNFVTFNVPMNRGDARTRLATVGPVTLYGTCVQDPNTPANADAEVTAETTAEHTYTYNDHDLNPGETVSIQDSSGPATGADLDDYSYYEPMFYSPVAGGSFDDDGESAGFLVGGPGAECRFFGSLPLIPAG